MQNKTLMMKLIGVILVLMLSLGNFLVLVSYAAEISNSSDIDVSSQDSRTNNKNIEFDSYLRINNQKTYSGSLDMAQANKIYLNIKLSNAGYLKTGLINFEDETFKIKAQDEATSMIQNIDYDKNEILLNQVNSGTEVELEIPIEIAKKDMFNIQNLNKNNKVLFTGTYVTQKGKEIEIEKEIYLNINWNTDTDLILEQNLSKYINNLENETLVEIKLDSGVNQNSMPVKEAVIEVEIPEIEEKSPKYVSVVADKLLSTTGESDGANFGKENFEYSAEEKKLKINVQNLENESGEVYWKQGLDEYKIILMYEKLTEEEKTLQVNTKAIFDIYGKNEKVEKDINTKIVLNENIGTVNEVICSSSNADIYKSFMYANSEYETEYDLTWKLNIGYGNISDKVVLSDVTENFVDSETEKTDTNKNTYYKQTIINKKNFEKILGEEGYIKILNNLDEEIVTITPGMTESEDIIVNYKNTDLSKIKIETSKPKTEGTLEITHKKAIKAQTDFEKDLIKTFVKLENEINLNTTYIKTEKLENEEENIIETEIVNVNTQNYINLLEPETKVEIKTNKEALTTDGVNEDVEIYINLINNKVEYSLFSNSIIDVKLPKEIDYLKLKDAKLIFEEELAIENQELYEAEDGTKHIKITLSGRQTKYNIGSIISGSSLILVADMSLNLEETKQAEVELVCINDGSISNAKTAVNLVKVDVQEEEKEETKEEQVPEEEQEKTEENVQDEEENEEENVPDEEEEQREELTNLELTISSNRNDGEIIRWGEIVKYTINLKNNNEETLNNIDLIGYVPEGAVYTTTNERDVFGPISYTDKEEVKTVKWNIEKLASGETITKEYEVRFLRNIEENIEILTTAKVYVGHNEIEAVSNRNILDKAYVQINMECNIPGDTVSKGDSVKFHIRVDEIYGEDLKNAHFKFNLPVGTVCEDAYIIYYSEEEKTFLENRDGFVVNNDVVEKKDFCLERYEIEFVEIILKIEDPYKISSGFIGDSVEIQVNGISNYSNSFNIPVDIPQLEVKQMSSVPEGNIKPGSILKYIIQVKNIGNCIVRNIELTDVFPTNSVYLKTERYIDGEKKDVTSFANGKATTIFDLPVGETAICVVSVEALRNGQEKFENTVKVSAKGFDEIKANDVTHTVKDTNVVYTSSNNTSSSTNNENKTYSINGIAWNDANSNGIREIGEAKLTGIEVLLLNNSNEIVKTVNTNSNGEYKFEGLENGKYTVIFVYDLNEFAITRYNVQTDPSINSDAIPNKATINGKEQAVGITDNINIDNCDINNIDIGLVKNPKFDLKIDKYVDSISVKTAKGEKKYDYTNAKLAKIEFASKEIDNSSIEITYLMKVVNEGQVEGYATKIVDYMPSELTFDKAKNPDWYQGENGEVYTNVLENMQILPGESKEIRLVLTKKMSGEDTGLINNNAEIYSGYNNLGLKDIDSTYGNAKSSEDDMDFANVYLGIKTGKTILYISLIISQIIILGVGIYLIKTKVLDV